MFIEGNIYSNISGMRGGANSVAYQGMYVKIKYVTML